MRIWSVKVGIMNAAIVIGCLPLSSQAQDAEYEAKLEETEVYLSQFIMSFENTDTISGLAEIAATNFDEEYPVVVYFAHIQAIKLLRRKPSIEAFKVFSLGFPGSWVELDAYSELQYEFPTKLISYSYGRSFEGDFNHKDGLVGPGRTSLIDDKGYITGVFADDEVRSQAFIHWSDDSYCICDYNTEEGTSDFWYSGQRIYPNGDTFTGKANEYGNWKNQ